MAKYVIVPNMVDHFGHNDSSLTSQLHHSWRQSQQLSKRTR